MGTAARLGAFGAAAVVVFGIALLVGKAFGPFDAEPAEHGHDRVSLKPVEDGHTGHGDGPEKAAQPTLDLTESAYDAGRQRLRFTVRDASGEPITAYDVQHEKLLHLVVVRRDLGGYRHVHPTLDEATGEWAAPLDLDAGVWRVYADFTPSGGSASLAEADLSVGGDYRPAEPAPDNDTATVAGFEVHLAHDGEELRLHVQRDGEDVTDLEPYLGAYGHLVAIRADDLAYLHVHPEDGAPGPEVAFHAALDEPGRYRLFFEFQHGGEVHRAELGLTVDGEPSDAPEHEEESGGHDH